MPDFLDAIRGTAEARAADARRRRDELERRCAALAAPRPLARSGGGFDLIAEVKRRAPSGGVLAPEALDPTERAAQYARAGAAAISVLTEPHHFDGGLSDLEEISGSIEVPTLAKDFLLDPAQLFEARLSGASGALLIVRMLDDSQLESMIDAAAAARLFLLVESFDEADLARIAAVVDRCRERSVELLLGVNARDLNTMELRFDRFERFRPLLPPGIPTVAESGVLRPEDAAAVARLGYDLALVGTALMRAPQPLALAAEMLAAARAERAHRASEEVPCA